MKLLNENISKNILNKLNESDFVNKTMSGTLSTIEAKYESFVDKWFSKFNNTIVNKHNLVVDEFLDSNCSKSIDELKIRVHDSIESYRNKVTPNDIIELEIRYWSDTSYKHEGFIASFVVELDNFTCGRIEYITQEYYNKKNKDKEKSDKLHQYVQRVSNDDSKSYYLLDDEYLQEVVKDEKYYDSDLTTWSCYDADTIKTARKFKSFDSATKFLDKRYDYYSDTHRISGLTDNVEVVSLNQLLSGEVVTKTDLSSLKSTKPSKPIEEPEDDDTLSDEVTYTLTAEDGKVFTYTEPDYKNPEEAPNYEDMPIWNDIVKYSEDKGFNEIKSNDIDRVLVWTRDENGNWIYDEEKSI